MTRTEQVEGEVWWKREGLGNKMERSKRNGNKRKVEMGKTMNRESQTKEAILKSLSVAFFTWPLFNSTVQHLHLDLFSPVNFDDPFGRQISVEDLAPLTNLRCLRSLKLVGMLVRIKGLLLDNMDNKSYSYI